MVGRIAIVGSIMTDLTTYAERMAERGETLAASSFAIAPGGKGANQAVAAARLGSDVLMVGRVGDDAFGTAACENLRSCSVDTGHVRVVAGMSTGVASIVVEADGENRILIVRGANDALTPGDVAAAADDLATCDAIVVQLEVQLETVYAAIEFGVRHRICVIVNPAPAAEIDIARLRGVAFVVPNQTELASLTGLPVAKRADAAVAAQALIARGVERVIVTLGADGALLVDANAQRHVPGTAVEALDTTGAGDAFIGSFAHHLARGIDVERAIGAAVRYAGHSVTQRGAQSSYARVTELW